MTKQLTRFTIVAAAWCVPYLVLLGYLLSRQRVAVGAVGSVVVAFTAVLTSVERYARRRDEQRDVRYNLSLRYSLVSIVASSLGAALWAIKAQNAWLFLGVEAVLVAMIIVLGVVTDKSRIKGSSKDELFQ